MKNVEIGASPATSRLVAIAHDKVVSVRNWVMPTQIRTFLKDVSIVDAPVSTLLTANGSVSISAVAPDFNLNGGNSALA